MFKKLKAIINKYLIKDLKLKTPLTSRQMTLSELVEIKKKIIEEIKHQNELFQFKEFSNPTEKKDLLDILDKLQTDLQTVKLLLAESNFRTGNNKLIISLENKQKKLNNLLSLFKTVKNHFTTEKSRKMVLASWNYDRTVYKLKNEISQIKDKLTQVNNSYTVPVDFVFTNYNFLQTT